MFGPPPDRKATGRDISRRRGRLRRVDRHGLRRF
jgi:hypothetical protein